MRIKDIFEKVIPGYYDSLYSELCKATHSNPLLQAIFRGNVSKSVPIKSNINNINLDWFSYVTNQLEPLIIGTIELYKYELTHEAKKPHNNTINPTKYSELTIFTKQNSIPKLNKEIEII